MGTYIHLGSEITDMVHRAVILVLLDVSMSTELNIRSSRSVWVEGTSNYRHKQIGIRIIYGIFMYV